MSGNSPSPGIGIVHLGVGAFHRAHQAVYTQAAMATAGGDWGICGVSLRSPAVRDQLAPRGNRYTLAVRDNGETSYQDIEAIREVLVAPENPAAVIQRLADPAIRVVTLTVTEKGYHLSPATGALDVESQAIAADLARPEAPNTTVGLLCAGLAARRAGGAGGVTLVSCDNLSGNGQGLRTALLDYAGRVDAELAAWIDAHCRFPCTVVDRIVPATTAADRDAVETARGFRDEAVVVTEPFSQWIIEDDFAGPIPAWDRVGARLVPDVRPYEALKLRLLNASHSAMAYLGGIAGMETVADVVSNTAFARLLEQLMQEMAVTLEGLGDFDVVAYRQALMERFANRGLQHLTRQIAMDGSQKIPQRLLPGLQRQCASGTPGKATLLVLAAWIRYTMGTDERGETFVVDDPMAARFAEHRDAAGGNAVAYLERLLADSAVFPDWVAQDTGVARQVTSWMEALDKHGATATVNTHWG